jgi:RNA polymerase sigma-70 factor (ECF subfamily)
LSAKLPPGGGESSTSRDARRLATDAVLPHLDAAFNLARWLMGNDSDAADIVQEACLRAMRSAGTFRGGVDGRAWLLAIVRNASFDALRKNNARVMEELRENVLIPVDEGTFDPQEILLRAANVQRVREAIQSLPPGIREVIVLREMEGYSYKEIAGIVQVPIGTIMSRLARGRRRLAELLCDEGKLLQTAPET